VPKIITSDTVKLFSYDAIGILVVISNHNSFRVLLDKIASVYFVGKIGPTFIFLALEMASAGNQHCANCIGTLSFPIAMNCGTKR